MLHTLNENSSVDSLNDECVVQYLKEAEIAHTSGTQARSMEANSVNAVRKLIRVPASVD